MFKCSKRVKVERFASGKLQLESDRKPCLPAQLSFQEDAKVDVTLHEGRYHQVRRMFAACGNHVTALHRPSIGEYTLEGIAEGDFRVMAVRDTEVLGLRKSAAAEYAGGGGGVNNARSKNFMRALARH